MRQEKTTLEIIAPTVEEAVANGLNQLGVSEDAVEVEILDPGSRGFLGLGTRQARVRLALKTSGIESAAEPVKAVVEPEKPVKPVEKPAAATVAAPVSDKSDDEAIDDTALKTAEQVTGELLQKMSIKARVKATIVPPADESDQDLIMVEIQGEDLSILIGRRSETLNALQYIASLIIAKEVGHWVPIMIDVQGYRARRERQLRVLARRSAEQVMHTGRKMTLEPMPANERRVIHLELRDHSDVVTESVGEEPNRKVTIFLKKNQSR
jgi:spoIIIJ-associated protein